MIARRVQVQVAGAVGLLLIGAAIGAKIAGVEPAFLHTQSAANLRDSCGASELLIGVRGSGEHSDDPNGPLGGTLNSVFHQFSQDMRPTPVAADPIDYVAIDVPTAMNAVNPETRKLYDLSYHQGNEQLVNALYLWNHKCPNYRFVLAGYSQGADVVANVMAGLNPSNPVEAAILAKIDGVALFGDPRYNPSDTAVTAHGDARSGGLLRLMFWSDHHSLRSALPSVVAGRVRSWCTPGDPVCDLDPTRFRACASALKAIAADAAIPAGFDIAACAAAIQRGVAIHLGYPGAATNEAGAWLAQQAKQRTSAPQPGGNPGSPGGTNPPVGVAGAPCDAFVGDVTIPDGTTLTPGQQATKTWQLRNCGSTPWSDTRAVIVSGTGAPAGFAVPPAAPRTTVPVTLTFTAPTTPGHYRWTYRLANGKGAAAATFWADFTVTGAQGASPPAVAGGRDCTAFVADVTVPDGAAVQPGQTITKTWKLRNCGTTDWSGLHAARVSGTFGPATFPIGTTAPGTTSAISATITVPVSPGRYRATYRLQRADGAYAANTFWVEVVVQAPPPPAAPGDRFAITSYNRLAPGAAHAEWYQAWQDFPAASNTLTRLAINVGDPRWAPGPIGVTTTIRLCRDAACTQQAGAWQAQINNYGSTTVDIGDFPVTPGATYFLRYDRPDSAHSWAVYYWGPGTYNNLSASIYGYNR